MSGDGAASPAGWEPFVLCRPGERPPRPRDVALAEGVGDRLRTAAFAELQAVRAFRWALDRFDDVPAGLRLDWQRLVPQEQRHYDLIRRRMAELGIDPAARPVWPSIWESVRRCETGEQFCHYITSAEERGRQAGLQLCVALGSRDPETAAIFQTIVDEEREHVALAARYFG